MKTNHVKSTIEPVLVPSEVNLADRFEVESIFRAARSPHSWAANQRDLRVSPDNLSLRDRNASR